MVAGFIHRQIQDLIGQFCDQLLQERVKHVFQGQTGIAC
jgi:hypothetical protein